MEELTQMVDALIESIEIRAPKSESVEWYLLNNLHRYKDVLENTPSRHEIENETHVLNRFCIDSMDWSDPLFKAVTAITEQAKRAIVV